MSTELQNKTEKEVGVGKERLGMGIERGG